MFCSLCPYLATLFFIVISSILAGFLWAQRRRVHELKDSRSELQLEESRVFDFLHGLGEAFSGGVRSKELHRLIVEGAVRILSATGGALYFVDRDEKMLVPSFVTEHSLPFIVVPDFIQKQSPALLSLYGTGEQTNSSIKSFLRLHTIVRSQGLLGEAWEWTVPQFLTREELPPELVAQGLDSALMSPLRYHNKTVGVLALGNAAGTSFSKGGLDLFRLIVEQSSFALYHQAVYREAGEKKLLDRDVEIAGEIQKLLLPSEAPTVSNYEISGINIPARTLSGDYFDYFNIDADHLGIAIADVSGKGIPASLIMAMCRGVLRSHAFGSSSPSEVLRRVNRQLYPDIKEDMFISMAYVTINKVDNTAQLARAGHDAPLLYHAHDGSIEKLNPNGMAVGIDSGEVFDRFCTDFSFRFEAGDCLLLYTDGVTEALNADGREFGIERLMHCLKRGASSSSSSLLKNLTEELQSFVAHQPQYDDITLIAIRKL